MVTIPGCRQLYVRPVGRAGWSQLSRGTFPAYVVAGSAFFRMRTYRTAASFVHCYCSSLILGSSAASLHFNDSKAHTACLSPEVGATVGEQFSVLVSVPLSLRPLQPVITIDRSALPVQVHMEG